MGNATKFWSRNLKGRALLEDLGIGVRTILRRISNRYGSGHALDSGWRASGDFSQHGQLSDY
jgi:hypothetical protein